MIVGMLAAGLGRRLGQTDGVPKILLEFGGETLLARHVAILRHYKVARVYLVVGYRADDLRAEIARIGANDLIETIDNPAYEEGSVLSLQCLGPALRAGEPCFFMDGDVLYDHRMFARLMGSRQANCFLMDRQTEEGEDPVKLCLRDGRLVGFHKRPDVPHDWWGEWIGFGRFAPEIAAKVAAAADTVAAGDRTAIYETAVQRVLHAEPPGTFGVEDVTGLPWVEIDFPEDLDRAHTETFPRLQPLPGNRPRAHSAA